MSATVQITIVCDACGRTLPTTPATGRKDWGLQVSTCADFDRLAAQIPTPKDRRWLSGDRTSLGLAERHHAGEGGMLYHLCTGAECAQDDLFGGVA